MSVGGSVGSFGRSKGERKEIVRGTFDPPSLTIAEAKNRMETIVMKLLQRELVHCRGDNNIRRKRETEVTTGGEKEGERETR